MKLLTRQSRNAGLFILVRSFSLLVPLMTLPLLGRALNPDGIGLLGYVQAIALYGSVAVDFGLNVSAISMVARNRGNPRALTRMLWSLTLLRAIPFVVCAGALWLYTTQAAMPTAEQAVLQVSLLLLASVLLTPTWLYQGLECGAVFSGLSVLPRVAIFPLIVLFVNQPEDVSRAALILFGAEAVAALGLFAYAWARLAPGRPQWSMRLLKVAAHRSFDIWLGTMITTSIAAVTPVLLKAFAGLYAVGLYTAADRLVRAFHSLLYPVVQAYQAEVTLRWKQSGNPAALIRTLAALLLAAALCFFLGVQAWASEIATLVFGNQFADAAPILQILALWPAFAIATSLGIHFLYVARGARKGLKSSYLIACSVHFVILPPIAYFWSGAGAAVGMVATQAVLAALILGRSKSFASRWTLAKLLSL